MIRPVCVVGGQYGSEGKGVLVAKLANEFDVHVRVGGPNAGHSFRHDGRLWKMRSLPCGWINPDATLVIGAGALFDPVLLCEEIKATGTPSSRVIVDHKAFVINEGDRRTAITSQAQERYGSTLEGVGAARARRLARQAGHGTFVTDVYDQGYDDFFSIADTSLFLSTAIENGSRILLEGAQGLGLSLIHGPWPFTTSHDTTAAQLLADVGLPPEADVILVLRTYPIRVGGNSGPMKNEISWGQLSAHIGRPVQEFTTVTGRLRRVAEFDEQAARRAVRMNLGTGGVVALMFLDYVFPEVAGLTAWDDLPREAQKYVEEKEVSLGAPIRFVGTGGFNFAVITRETHHDF